MRNSIHDVAKRAGVSISTVSRVINHSAGVKDSKVKAVKEALEYYDYQPSQFGRGLVKQTSGMIGVYSPYSGSTMFDNGYMLECLRGIDRVIGSSSYSLLLINEVESYYRHEKIKPKFWDYVRQNKIDGLIVVSVPADGRLENTLSAIMDDGFKVGYIGRKFHESGLNVYAQYDTYMNSILEQYYQLGHRRVFVLADQYKYSTIADIKSSLERKYEDLLMIPYLVNDGNLNVKMFMDILDQSVRKDKCTGIVCGTVYEATKAISALNMLNLSVPEDVSLIAVEHKKEEGALLFPRVNCYYVPAMKMGEDIAKSLIKTLQGNPPEVKSKIFQPQYIARDSVKAVK